MDHAEKDCPSANSYLNHGLSRCSYSNAHVLQRPVSPLTTCGSRQRATTAIAHGARPMVVNDSCPNGSAQVGSRGESDNRIGKNFASDDLIQMLTSVCPSGEGIFNSGRNDGAQMVCLDGGTCPKGGDRSGRSSCSSYNVTFW